jgi:hypothetical protein
MLAPNAFSMRRAISGEREALPARSPTRYLKCRLGDGVKDCEAALTVGH